LEREHARLSAARALGERHPHWYLHRGLVWWAVFGAAVIGAVMWAGREGAAVLARVDVPSMPHWSAPDLPGVPWLTVAWAVAVLAVVGLAVWLWCRQSYGLPWRYRLRRMWRRY
jgi:hypothetical protein